MPAVVLAHGVGGWASFATLAAAGVIVVFLLVVTGVLTVRRGGDLVLPLSAVLLLAGSLPVPLGPLDELAPLFVAGGAVLLATLVAAAVGRLRLRSPRTLLRVLLAVAGAALVATPFTL